MQTSVLDRLGARVRACGVIAAATVALAGILAAAAPAQAEPALRAGRLTTEHAKRPLGIDEAAPRFGWTLTSGLRDQAQTAYRIVVATSRDRLTPGRADVWDSGRVRSSRSYDVRYGGPALRSSTRYYWRVRAWGRRGAAPWSRASWFETGLLSPSDWKAHWIGAPPASSQPQLDFAGASWMWYPEGDPTAGVPAGDRWFRYRFDVPDGARVADAKLLITVDDAFTAYLNGQQVARSIDDPEAWRHPQLVTIAPRAGENVLAVAAHNNPLRGGPSPAGVLLRARISYADGSTRTIEGGDGWQAAKEVQPGWNEPGAPDAGWVPARRTAAAGDAPWGAISVQAPEQPAPLLRRSFRIEKPVASARLYVAGAAYADVSLNGRPVSDHVLDPGFTRYDRRIEYVTDDVTGRLRPGTNVLGARLGRGFFGMTTPDAWNWDKAPWNGEPRALIQLEVTYADGSHETLGSDSSWRWHDGPTLRNSLYSGETYDARLAQPGWDAPGFADAGWAPAAELPAPGGRLVAAEHEPIRITETLRPVSVTEPEPGVFVFALARNVAGWARIHVHGPAGTELTLRYGEKLNPDGTVQASNGLVTGEFQTDHYVLRGAPGTETWEPRFSYKGFQYVEVRGWPGTPTADDLDGRVLHSDVASIGRFATDNRLFRTLRTLTRRTVLNNLHSIPTDTPMYEKNGWTGDAMLMAETDLLEFDMARIYTKWMDDIRDSVDANGRPPAIAPDGGWGQGPYGAAPPWNAAYVLIPWWMYEYRGDRGLLADHYAAMKRFMDWEIARAPSGIHSSFLGDYLAPGYHGNPPEDLSLAGTAYAYEMAVTMAKAAGVLGHPDDAERFRAAAAHMRDAFNAKFLDADANVYRTATDPGFRQTHQVLALAFGLVPADRVRPVVDNLVADVHARGDHLDTGALGTKYLLRVLTEHGHGELAYRIANQRTYPSWGYWVDNGATTLWEMWDLGARSHDHAFLGGAIDEWFFEDLAGLRPAAPGFGRVDVYPHPLGDLRRARASTRTVHGRVAAGWRRTGDDGLRLRVRVPVGSSALVHVPAASADAVTVAEGRRDARYAGMRDGRPTYEVGSGAYLFTVDTGGR